LLPHSHREHSGQKERKLTLDTFLLTTDKTNGEIGFLVALMQYICFEPKSASLVAYIQGQYEVEVHMLSHYPSPSISGLYIRHRFKDMFCYLCQNI